MVHLSLEEVRDAFDEAALLTYDQLLNKTFLLRPF
jgi:hypothetical protein